MKSEKIRLLVHEKVITRAEVKTDGQHWQLVLFRGTTGHNPITYEKDKGGPRCFKTLEAVASLVQSLGLKRLEIIL
jgi:hypothetical protein